ncbi:hypothetical protein ABT173_25790 [Streptomyces sp. NPDC001795]|uniref:hypothetical protein n=1 Tax=unclassified Streptomyces TaxID=2593676 RepID=UPI0033334A1D
MHRTTTATLLVTVAVSALTGCVTIRHPAVPGPPPAPSRPPAPRADGSSEPRVVQAPAREALEMVQPSDRPSPSAAARRHTPRPASTGWPAAPHRPPAAPHPKPGRPAPRIEVPPTVPEVFPRNAEVCALGRTYGGWKPDSPEATICRSTYGR